MRYHSLMPALALGTLWLAACTNDATEPTVEPTTSTPELSVASNTWIQKANMPANRTNMAVATISNANKETILYTIGGRSPYGVIRNVVTAYNATTNTWKFRQPLPGPLTGTNGAGVLNGKIYVTGGYGDYGPGTSGFPWMTVYMYDPATNSWTRKHDMPVIDLGHGDRDFPSGGGSTAVINDKLYVLSAAFIEDGGANGFRENSHSLLFRYNPGSDTWTPLPAPFAGIVTAAPYVGGVIAGKFYVMAQSPYTDDSYFAVYDPATNQWTAKTSPGQARLGAATVVLGSKLYSIGDNTIVYNPATDTWARWRAPMPNPRSGISAAKVVINGYGRIEVVGGNAPGNNMQYIP